MPMCDIFIPTGALLPEAEQKLVARVSELLVDHELRRITDLMDDPESVKASRERAGSIAWMFVHRTDTYLAGRPIEAPHYKFVVSIPEGTIDDRFAPAINRDIFAALVEAEGGKWPKPEQRVWVHIHEVLDGRWGAGGRVAPLKWVVDYVAPGLGDAAVARFEAKRKSDAEGLVALAGRSDAPA